MKDAVYRRQGGFTLIEILIVIVIIGILASIAIPSYQNSVYKSRRADAQAALMGLAQAMERHFTSNNTYEGAANAGADTGAPAIFATQSPIDGNPKAYNLRITAATGTSFTVQAQPIGGGPQDGDGILQMNHLGQRVWDRDNDADLSEATDACWDVSC